MAKDVKSPLLDGMLIAVRSGNMTNDCFYIFGHNFLNICPIFELFFFKFPGGKALSYGLISHSAHKVGPQQS